MSVTSVVRWATKVTRQQGHPIRHTYALSLRSENILICRESYECRYRVFLRLSMVPDAVRPANLVRCDVQSVES